MEVSRALGRWLAWQYLTGGHRSIQQGVLVSPTHCTCCAGTNTDKGDAASGVIAKTPARRAPRLLTNAAAAFQRLGSARRRARSRLTAAPALVRGRCAACVGGGGIHRSSQHHHDRGAQPHVFYTMTGVGVPLGASSAATGPLLSGASASGAAASTGATSAGLASSAAGTSSASSALAVLDAGSSAAGASAVRFSPASASAAGRIIRERVREKWKHACARVPKRGRSSV